jgi:hypothetical protein
MCGFGIIARNLILSLPPPDKEGSERLDLSRSHFSSRNDSNLGFFPVSLFSHPMATKKAVLTANSIVIFRASTRLDNKKRCTSELTSRKITAQV